MQTFLPYDDFKKTAHVLDRQRLGKQRVENLQILKAIFGESKGWTNHPATKMWANNIWTFAVYHQDIVFEWLNRGYKDTTYGKFFSFLEANFTPSHPRYFHALPPVWLGNEKLHSSHRANLLRKDPDYYGQYGWTEEPAEGYWWPNEWKTQTLD